MRDTIRSNGSSVYVYVYMYFFFYLRSILFSLSLYLPCYFFSSSSSVRRKFFQWRLTTQRRTCVTFETVKHARAIGERCVLNPVPYKTSPEDSHSNSAVGAHNFRPIHYRKYSLRALRDEFRISVDTRLPRNDRTQRMRHKCFETCIISSVC